MLGHGLAAVSDFGPDVPGSLRGCESIAAHER
jgi:hypothetical protein